MLSAALGILAAQVEAMFEGSPRQAEIFVLEMGFGLALEGFDLIGIDLEGDFEESAACIAIVLTACGTPTKECDFELDFGLERI
jgi:hypothetical protein